MNSNLNCAFGYCCWFGLSLTQKELTPIILNAAPLFLPADLSSNLFFTSTWFGRDKYQRPMRQSDMPQITVMQYLLAIVLYYSTC
mmetsp:Transcript_15408/g.21469  ORF Transcript_15408/g.21469 Transcript_15408/m.21469 type:complete len:85 (+) Transcript_15408:54-308(+)